MNDMNDKDWFEKQQKRMIGGFGLAAIIIALLNIGILCGFVYFVFWCLKHFGVIS